MAATLVLLGGTMAIVVHGGMASLLRLGLHQVQGALDVVVVLELQALLCPTRVELAERVIRCPSRDGKEIMEIDSSRDGRDDGNVVVAEETTLDRASSRGEGAMVRRLAAAKTLEWWSSRGKDAAAQLEGKALVSAETASSWS